jgi:hypothetical protein
MPSSHGEIQREEKEVPDLVTFAEIPDRLERRGLKRISPSRVRQLAETDPDWPIPLDQAQKAGRIRLFDWNLLEPYFVNRVSRQGARTDLKGDGKKA